MLNEREISRKRKGGRERGGRGGGEEKSREKESLRYLISLLTDKKQITYTSTQLFLYSLHKFGLRGEIKTP